MTSQRLESSALGLADAAEQRRLAIRADVCDGFSRTPRQLPPKYFYDERGSRLFEEITRLPEYYLTRAEREILLSRTSEIVADVRPRTLLELGAGSAGKTRILLGAMRSVVGDVTYVPVDVSEDFLDETRLALEREDAGLHVEPVVADIGVELEVPAYTEPPILFAFLGSTIGNFDEPAAIALLERVRARMGLNDRLLLGTDLRKDRDTLHAAYNDTAGVTAEFNRNMLRVLNAELGANFAPERFEHRAFYNGIEHRIEMYLHSVGVQLVCVPGLPPVVFHDGEGLRTELSYKYDRAAVDALAAAAQLRVTRWMTDAAGRFALSLLEPVG
jgi:L-histidine N-alpha-methyltransferase